MSPRAWRCVGLACVLGASSALGDELDGGAFEVDAGPSPADAGVTVTLTAPPRDFYREEFHGTAALTGLPFLYEVSFVVGGGGYVHAPGVSSVPMTGVRVREKNGFLSYALLAVLGNLAQGLGAVSVSNVKSTSTKDTVYNPDGSRSVVTNTVTTATVTAHKTPEQLEADQKSLRESLAGVTWIELTVYADNFLGWNRGASGGSGYELAAGGHGNLFFIGELPVVLDVGLHLANIRIPAPPGSGVGSPFLYWASGGIVGRLHVPVSRLAAVDLEWVLNFLSFDYIRGDAALLSEGRVVSSPLKLGVELYATDRVVLRGEAVLGGLGFTDGRLGLFVSAGVRL